MQGHVSFDAETSIIMLTHPHARVGNVNVSRAGGDAAATRSIQHLSEKISEVLFVYLRLANDDHDFAMDDATPLGHARFGTPNQGNYVIFNATMDCNSFKNANASYDIVTDGDQPLKKKLGQAEVPTNKLAGPPQHKKAAGDNKLKKRYDSRCASAAANETAVTPKRPQAVRLHL